MILWLVYECAKSSMAALCARSSVVAVYVQKIPEGNQTISVEEETQEEASLSASHMGDADRDKFHHGTSDSAAKGCLALQMVTLDAQPLIVIQ